MRGLLVFGLLGLIGCGGASSKLGGVTVGAHLDPADPRFAAGDRESQRLLVAPGTFLGRQLDRVEVTMAGDVVEQVVLIAAVQEAAGVEALITWARRVCAHIGGTAEEHTPSPLGTPSPGEAWDPVITTITRCDGRKNGLEVRVNANDSSADDFHNANVEIVGRRPEPVVTDP